MSSKEEQMTFWDHLDDLRGVLIRIAILVIVLGAVWFPLMPWFFDKVILAPTHGSFPLYSWFASITGEAQLTDFEAHLINTQLASQLFVHFTTTCWMSVVTGFPIVLYLLWTFVSPALYDHEKRGIRKAFLFGNVMFYLGVSVGYFLVFPLTLRFLADYQLSEAIPNVITIDSYIDNFFTLILVMGIVFELPLIAWLLGRMGLLGKSFFNKYRRHAIVVLLIAAALITPTGDPFTLMVVFIPLYVLWEFSAYLMPKTQKANDDNSDRREESSEQ